MSTGVLNINLIQLDCLVLVYVENRINYYEMKHDLFITYYIK